MISKIKYSLVIFLFLPFLILIKLIKPFVLIRFGNLSCNRIGAFSTAEIYLLHKKFIKKSNTLDIWVTGDYLSNKQLLVILKRKFFILQQAFIFWQVLKIISKYLNIYSEHLIKFGYENANNREYLNVSQNLFDKHPVQLCLTKQEIAEGEKILKKFNIPKKAKIICVSARDDSYLKKTYPSLNFAYHDYRDTNIKNFVPAIKTLIKKNFYVVRMGKIAEKKLNIKDKKFIDYPFHPLKSDFMDFFFAYKCYFWLGSNSGLDRLANVFRKPLAILNLTPIMPIRLARKRTLIASKIYMNSKNKKLGISKIFDYGVSNFSRTEHLKKKKIKLKQLNPKQTKDIALEMIKLMKNSWKIQSKKDSKLQKKFKNLYLKKLKDHNFAFDQEKINSLYSLSFLKNNSWFLK